MNEYIGFISIENEVCIDEKQPIVRCHDCKHFCEDRRNTSIGWVDVFVCDSEQWSTSSLMPSHKVEPDGFCAWAERRDAVVDDAVKRWQHQIEENMERELISRICEVFGSARAERTCRSTTDKAAWCFVCSECGKSFPRSDLHLAHNHGEINYCPNCGAKVIEEKGKGNDGE